MRHGGLYSRKLEKNSGKEFREYGKRKEYHQIGTKASVLSTKKGEKREIKNLEELH